MMHMMGAKGKGGGMMQMMGAKGKGGGKGAMMNMMQMGGAIKPNVVQKAGLKRKAAGGGRIFVRGFDFGTTQEQLEAHCSTVGTVEGIEFCGKGEAIVTYSTAEEAAGAVEYLNKTTIYGNSRFIDVILQGDDDIPGKGAKKGNSKGMMMPMQMNPMMMQMMNPMMMNQMMMAMGGGGGGGGKGKGKSMPVGPDPPGSGRVFVRGFDFGTTEEMLRGHMETAGEIHDIQWAGRGEAAIVYTQQECAIVAAEQLTQSIIDGNTRYIDVILKDSEMGTPGMGAPFAMAMGGAAKGKGKGAAGPDPAGSGRVFVRGFDFGTTDEMLRGHMSAVGEVHDIQWAGKGEAAVVFTQQAAANLAAEQLSQSIIDGNTRYIDVILKASE